jgi:hypothetical protein
MTKFCKLINYVILATLFLICIAFGFFLKTNWNFILNPELVPGYVEGQSTFQYAREDLAYYRNWCYHYPMTIIPYLIYIESILLAHLIFKKSLLLTKLQLFTIVLFLLFIIFSDYIFDNLFRCIFLYCFFVFTNRFANFNVLCQIQKLSDIVNIKYINNFDVFNIHLCIYGVIL